MTTTPAQESAPARDVEHVRDRAELPQQYDRWQDYAYSGISPDEPVPGA